MAEHKKLSMLVKLDDGQTYTLGGDGADNAVTLDTEQTITGLKTFDKLPQSSVEPKADADLITKGYADGHYLPVDTKPHKYDILVKMKHDGTSWVGFSDFSVRLRDGTRLDVKHIENQSATTATQPVKAVFKTVKELNAPIEAPAQQAATFFDSYSLEAGEFTGTVSFYKVVGNFGPASYDINPWYVYVGSGNANNYDGIYAVSIDNLDKPLLGVNFKFGDAHNSSSYTCLQCGVVFTVDGSALEVAYDGDMSNAFETTIEYPINAQSMIGVVKVDNAQEITGAKTFTQNIKVTAKPKADTDVATVGYVSGLLNAKAPYDVTLDFKVEDDTDGGWVVYSNMEINLDNGKKLKCIHIDNTQPTSANAPVKAVFKAIPATEVINAAPAEQAPTFFDTYQLQDEEYLGTLTYGHILNSQLQDYASYKGPFYTNQYGTTCTIKEATQLRISISELPAAVSKVSLKFDGSYLPKTFKASMSGVGIDVTSNVLTNPSGNTPLELLFDVVKLTGLVTLDTAQTITGAKTFEVLPKSEATPVDDHELVNKSYVDGLVPSSDSYLTIKGAYDTTLDSTWGSYMEYDQLQLMLSNGQYLVPLYMENTKAQDTKEAVKVIYQLSNKPYQFTTVQMQPKDWFDSYSLKENELSGLITFGHLLGSISTHASADYCRPFDQLIVGVNNSGTPVVPMIKFSFFKLPAQLYKVDLKMGHSYPMGSVQIECAANGEVFTSKTYTKAEDSLGPHVPLSIIIGLNGSTFVTTNTVQSIEAAKTFNVLPQSEGMPMNDADLVNKAYVDALVGGVPEAPDGAVTTTVVELLGEIYYYSGGGINSLQLVTKSGKTLKPLYIEDVLPKDATDPVQIIYALADTSAVATRKEKSFFDTYSLQDNEVKGTITFAHLCDAKFKEHESTYADPFDSYLIGSKNGLTEFGAFLKLTIEDLPSRLAFLQLTHSSKGDTPRPGYATYAMYSLQAIVKADDLTFTSKLYNTPGEQFVAGQTLKIEFKYASTTLPSQPNFVTLNTEQTITAVKTFEKLPKSDAVPADANELVNKAYVDAAAKSLQGYEITLYGTPKTNGLIGFKNLRFYFANGLRLYPRLVDDTAANTANEAKRFIWTLVNTSSYEDVQAQAKPKAELDKYVLTSSEYDGLITYPQTCGQFTLTRDNWFAIGGYVRVQGQASNGEQPIVKLRVLGSVAPITKMELTIDSDANYIAESLRAEVSKIGDTPKASNTVNPTAVNELVTFNIEETFKPDAYYVNRFDDQDVFGRKAFKSVPKIDKAPAAYGIAEANEGTAFGDLYGSAAIAKPVSQSVNFDIGTTSQRKAPSSGSVWQTQYTCKVQIYNFAPKIRRPDTYEEAQLYLKAVGPSSEGYRGILSLEKPSNYPQLSSIQVMDQDTMNGYKLQANEYFCKLQYLTGSGNKSRTEEALNNALKSGSDKIKQLFSSDASEWWTATSSWHRDHASANNPDDIPWAVVNLFIYNAPVLCAVPASNSSSYTSRRNDTLSVTSAAYYANVSTSLDLPAVNWAQKVRDVQMCSVDVLAAIRALQKTNTALEARIKALEDAAPKP